MIKQDKGREPVILDRTKYIDVSMLATKQLDYDPTSKLESRVQQK